MKLGKAIVESVKYYKKLNEDNNTTHSVAICREGKENYPFFFIPEYSVITLPFDREDRTTWRILDGNSWRLDWLDVCIPETWLKKEDWKVYKQEED